MSVVEAAELAERTQQPLAVAAVPQRSLLLVLGAHQDLKSEEGEP